MEAVYTDTLVMPTTENSRWRHKRQIKAKEITIEYTSYGVSEEVVNIGTHYQTQ